MSTPKDLYLRNDDEVKAALAIVKSDVFERLLVFATSEFASRCPTTEKLQGANQFIQIMRTLPEDDSKGGSFPQPGLEHNIEVSLDRKPQLISATS